MGNLKAKGYLQDTGYPPRTRSSGLSGNRCQRSFCFCVRYGPDGNEPHGKFSRYYPLRYKALAAREKGAKALVFIDDSEDFAKSSLSKLQFDAEFADSGIAVLAVSQRSAREIFQKGGLDLHL